MQKHTHLPLAGVRVIDFGQQISGPAVAMVLADLGATVILIGPPQSPQGKSPTNATLQKFMKIRCLQCHHNDPKLGVFSNWYLPY
jgi:crotonobetainyl-CoA:carnitine CoA-transferase CaiB-like acyl-CoA transferase